MSSVRIISVGIYFRACKYSTPMIDARDDISLLLSSYVWPRERLDPTRMPSFPERFTSIIIYANYDNLREHCSRREREEEILAPLSASRGSSASWRYAVINGGRNIFPQS